MNFCIVFVCPIRCVEIVSNACRIMSRYGVSCHAVAPHNVNFCMSGECGFGQILFLGDALGDCVLVIVDISDFKHPSLG